MASPRPLFAARDRMPHISIRTIDGSTLDYTTIWQHRNMVLIVIGDGADDEAYGARLTAATEDFRQRDAVVVITHDAIDGLSSPGNLIVDRWGQVIHATHATRVDELLPVEELLSWLDYIQSRCG